MNNFGLENKMGKMTFKQLEEKVGLPLAVIIYEEKLPSDFFEKLSFDQLDEIRNISSDTEFTLKILDEMEKKAKTLEELVKIYNVTTTKIHQKFRILEKIRKMKKRSFDSWFAVYQDPSSNNELRVVALKKIREFI